MSEELIFKKIELKKEYFNKIEKFEKIKCGVFQIHKKNK